MDESERSKWKLSDSNRRLIAYEAIALTTELSFHNELLSHSSQAHFFIVANVTPPYLSCFLGQQRNMERMPDLISAEGLEPPLMGWKPIVLPFDYADIYPHGGAEPPIVQSR